MMRDGKPLGTLGWKTDRIFLMKSSKFDLTPKEIEDMENGKFIVRRKKK
jgi:hypothetical protein